MICSSSSSKRQGGGGYFTTVTLSLPGGAEYSILKKNQFCYSLYLHIWYFFQISLTTMEYSANLQEKSIILREISAKQVCTDCDYCHV